ncbi:MAG: xanthine dehydrogenase family protein molybdopterin-binding subunit [Synergistaceae bacterium]|nr:xanthine dehydrogenase family protein molybdopterin-binding subunit [Synergistaceae bacterium]
MPDYNIIGKPVARLDGYGKASGEALYIGDMLSKSAWVCGVVRSESASGVIRRIVFQDSFNWDKVTTITAKDLKSVNYVAMIRPDYPILADEEVIFSTQGVVLVAAPDEDTLKSAMSAITVEIDELPPVLTIEESITKKRVIYGSDNTIDEFSVSSGNTEAAFAEADRIIEGTYFTGYQEHVYLETQGMTATPLENGGVVITGSLQCPHYVHNAAVQALGLVDTPEKVVIKQAMTGGGFGGKEDYPSILGVWTALLALKSGRTVKFIYGREEDMLCTTKRHPSKISHKTAVKNDGTITAMEIDILLDGGAVTTMSKVVLSRSILHSTGCYAIPNARIRGRAMATNTPPNGAFRGFGAPQSQFALERHLDKIADELGLDPLDVRLKNIMRVGDKFPYGQVLESGASAERVLLNVVERSKYREKRAKYICENMDNKTRLRHGIGLSVILHGGGFTGAGEDMMGTKVKVEIDVNRDIISILASSAEMGQGASTVLPMLAAETFGVPLSCVEYDLPDTSIVPNSGPTVASRTTMYVGKVLQNASSNLISKIKSCLEATAKVQFRYEKGAFINEVKKYSIFEAAQLYCKENGSCSKISAEAIYEPAAGYSWDDEKYEGTAYKGYSWMAQVVEVSVDMDTYEVIPEKSTIAVELGRAINPILASGQIEGGTLQSYGWANTESLSLTNDGKYTARHLSGYAVPTTLDAPSFDVELLEEPCDFGALGAKGIGELPMDGGAPAMAAAVQNATGVFAEKIPISGEYLFSLVESNMSKTGETGAGGGK